MGKRELLLIAAFVLVGVVVYQVTAPATPASGGFSLSGLIAKIRSEIHGQDVQIPVVRSATASVPASIKTLKIDGLRASVTILGEARDDVAAELRATAFGADEAQAKAFEQAFQLELVPENDLLELRVKSAGQEMRRRRIELTIRVPRRLALELALLGGELKVSHVARVTFERGAGRAVLSEIADGVEGEYGPGALEIDSAGPVKLETDRTELRVSRITGSAELQAKGNQLRVREVSGPTTLSLERVEAEGEDLRGPVKVEGDGGEIRLRDVHAPVEVKGHRLTLRITLKQIVPVTADIENDLIEVTLPDTGGFTLDAHAENGQIRVPDQSVEVEPGDHEMRARGPVRDGGPVLNLHSSHGDIVIR